MSMDDTEYGRLASDVICQYNALKRQEEYLWRIANDQYRELESAKAYVKERVDPDYARFGASLRKLLAG